MDEPKNDNTSKLVQNLMEQLKKARDAKKANPNPNEDQPDRYQKMGLPEDWLKPTTVFVRTFRWTLDTPNHPKISMWVQKVNVNYKEKTIEIEVFEDLDGCVHEWLEDMIADASARNFTIKHYDGCGKTIFTNSYYGVEIKDHNVGYDYSNSDVLTHKLKLTFRRIKRSSNLTVN